MPIPWFLRNGLRSQRTRDGYVQANHLTCCWINFARLRSCRFCSSRLAPFAICSAALRLDSTTGCAAFRQQSPQIAFTRCNEKTKAANLPRLGLVSAAASRCKAPAMGMPALFGSRPGQ